MPATGIKSSRMKDVDDPCLTKRHRRIGDFNADLEITDWMMILLIDDNGLLPLVDGLGNEFRNPTRQAPFDASRSWVVPTGRNFAFKRIRARRWVWHFFLIAHRSARPIRWPEG